MPRLQDDFYTAINKEWLETAEIPEDKPATAAFVELALDIEKLLMETTDTWANNKDSIPDSKPLHEYVKLYMMANNYDKREELGVTPALPFLEKIEALTSFDDVSNSYYELSRAGINTLPYLFGVDEDMKDTSHYALYGQAPSLILPDKTYYEEDHPQAEQLLAIYFQMATSILQTFGKSADEAEKLATQTIEFDKIIAPYTKSSTEKANYVDLYNPYKVGTLDKHVSSIDLPKIINKFTNSVSKEIIVQEPYYLEHMDEFLTNENFELYKSWAYTKTAIALSGALTDNLRILSTTYSRALNGIAEPQSKTKAAYYFAYNHFNMVVGDWYGKKYFGEEAKQDVLHMVKQMIEVYKNRLDKNTWLSKETRNLAIEKLDALDMHVGYPEKIEPYYKEFKVTTYEDGGNLLTNEISFYEKIFDYEFDKLSKPVDKDYWAMSPATVNAYFNPQLNCIVFPAAILQPPFYDIHQHPSANYGGIGAVMAHEISHAFDNNGSKFDKHGNLANWWTKEDFENFDSRAKQMIEAWDGVESIGGTVNGELTVSENIADAGGLSCALEAAKNEDNVDLVEFFSNWARVWRFKSSTEYAQMLLAVDVHAPAKLRCNMQVSNLDDFYSTFNVDETDEMYIEPKKRIAIW